MSLFWRVFVTNAALLVVAAIVLGVSPITVSWPIALTEAVVLTFGLVAMLVANALLLRPAFQPLERLARRMGDVDLLRPGQRFAVAARGEILALVAAFNQMLERLEAERRESGRRAVAGFGWSMMGGACAARFGRAVACGACGSARWWWVVSWRSPRRGLAASRFE